MRSSDAAPRGVTAVSNALQISESVMHRIPPWCRGESIAIQADLAEPRVSGHCPGMYYKMTEGIRITVRPRYATEHSDAAEPRHVFVYHIRIENVSERTAQLVWRHWYIHDDAVGSSEVQGEGVVGEQPVLAPGDAHEYESFCVLQGLEGWMEGYYEFQRSDASSFRAGIPRFMLTVPQPGSGLAEA